MLSKPAPQVDGENSHRVGRFIPPCSFKALVLAKSSVTSSHINWNCPTCLMLCQQAPHLKTPEVFLDWPSKQRRFALESEASK